MTLRLTESDLAEIQRKRAGWAQQCAPEPRKPHPGLVPGGHTKAAIKKKAKANPKGMNKTESLFARQLDIRKAAGELVWWAFEPFRIRLANGTFYRPDFVAVDRNGRTEVYEVKGFFREAAKVRLKVAAEKLPYPFYLVRIRKGVCKVVKV